MKRRILATLLAGAMLLTLAVSLTGCKEKEDWETYEERIQREWEARQQEIAEMSPEERAKFEDEIAKRENAVASFREAQGGGANGRTVINFYTFTTETVEVLLPLFLSENPRFSDDYYINVDLAADDQAHRRGVVQGLGGATGPDIFVADVDYAMQFAALSQTATIADLGITINEADFYKYTLDIMRRDGNIMGLSHQATPGAMYYRADIARELGIETEAEMQAAVLDWDKFIELAQRVTTETTFAMMYGADELKRNFINTRDEGWVVTEGNREIFNVCSKTMNEFVRVTGAINDMGGLVTNGLGQWSDGWFAGMSVPADAPADAGGVFSYFGSTWYLHWILRPNAREDKDADWEIGNGTHGMWGMVPGPASFFWGGTYWFGSKSAANDPVKAEGVRQIIEFFCVKPEGITAFVEETQDFTSNQTIARNYINDPRFNNDFFLNETNHYQVFAQIASRIDITQNVTRYDADMDTIFSAFITDIFVEKLSYETSMERMRESVRANIPSVVVR